MADFVERLNNLGQNGVPFLFIVDFEKESFEIFKLDELPESIKFAIGEKTYINKNITLKKSPVTFDAYASIFESVMDEIRAGNTYLLNLTFSTPIECSASLLEIYQNSNALFKLYFKERFISFSPERFITIKNNKIYTYPMKGTIDAALPNAKEIILQDAKESAEHVMIVDLLRNDLGIVAKEVKVTNFRYISEVTAWDSKLLQVSSEICGALEANWQKRVGEIVWQMLPAGSVSGTPKKKSCEIIKRLELHKRGWFCGVFGVFDGESLDSGVLIRFIEKTKDGLVYKSGGGITIESDAQKEYEEMIGKVYVPIF